MADWVSWVRALHIFAAVLWAGGALFVVAMIGPALRAAGPAAGGFMGSVFRRGGFAMFFMPAGVVAVLTGGILSSKYQVQDSLGTSYGVVLTIGAVLAVIALLDGFFGIMPVNKKLVMLARAMRGPPTAEQGAEMQALGEKLGKRSGMSAIIVGLALVCMLAARLTM